MGDMADLINDLDYCWDYDDDNYGPNYGPIKECKYCGESNLIWKLSEFGSWRLYEKDGTIHKCAMYQQKCKELRNEKERKFEKLLKEGEVLFPKIEKKFNALTDLFILQSDNRYSKKEDHKKILVALALLNRKLK